LIGKDLAQTAGYTFHTIQRGFVSHWAICRRKCV